MKVLSLFDGISCGRIALERAGIDVDVYYASEIDKYATKISEENYPDIIRLGDVTNWENWNIDWSGIDLVLAGFPCQAWSMAGQQQGDKDPRGALFWVTLDVIANVLKHNPKAKFLMENVRMKKEFEDYITHHTEQALGYVEKTLINSALVSAQNRNRFYWTNFKVSQPEDKGLVLKDILEDSQLYALDVMENVEIDSTANGIMNIKKGTSGKSWFFEQQSYVSESKSRALKAGGGSGNIPKILYRPCELLEKETTGGHIANTTDIRGHQSIKRVYNPNGKSPTLTTMGGGHREPKIMCKNGKYRKLSIVEMERLQTLPKNYTAAIETLSYSLYNYKEINNKEDLRLCDVKLMDAKENREQKSMATYALCTTSDLLGMELMSCQRLKAIKSQSVNIAIERLEKKAEGPEECVIDITKTGLDMETLYTQIRSELNLDQEATKSALVVKTSTERLLRITSEENYQEVRLLTILIAIRLITQLRICTYVTDRASMHYCIDSLKESQGNLLSVGLSYLKMETTRQTVSNTQRKKMIGNGWTVDVIAHILKHIK